MYELLKLLKFIIFIKIIYYLFIWVFSSNLKFSVIYLISKFIKNDILICKII